jgi:hypothetical protein
MDCIVDCVVVVVVVVVLLLVVDRNLYMIAMSNGSNASTTNGYKTAI